MRFFPVLILLLLLPTISSAQTLYDVVLGTNNKTITEVQIEFNGNTITQTSGGVDPTINANKTALPVLMNYIKINDGGTIKKLDFLNAKGAFLHSNNFTNATTGVGVYTEGTETLISNGVSDWEDAMQNMVTSRNALSYMFYDGSSNTPAGDDFDIYWSKALTNDDYLVVSERDGNTNFQLVPLDINGNPIAAPARELRFGKQNGTTSPNGNKKYDWNIGYGSLGRFDDQPQYFSVIDVSLFNTNQPIYGFRIDNLGDADVKFYGISDDTFENNPTNPLVPGLKGNVFNDIDKLTDNTVDGSGISTPSGTQLYVSLVDNSNDIIDTIPVNNDGSYAFLDNVEPNSNYTVVLHTNPNGSTTPNLPPTWTNIGEHQGTSAGNDGNVNGIIAVSVGTVVETEVNFGIVQQPGSIGDTVWYDTDGNESQNGAENGLQGATVTLDPGTPADNSDDLTTTTDANGNYVFDNLPAGNYTVSVDVSTVTAGLPAGVTPAELSQTFDNDGTGSANSSDVNLAAGENNLEQDFGYIGLGVIGDRVWYDTDGNESQNGAENGLQGATVTLDPGTPADNSDDLTTTTDANGNYVFDNLPAGNYTVSVDVSTVTAGLPAGVTPAELSQTFDNDGTGSANSSNVNLAAGENNLDQDFGYIGLGVIGDRVWYDADGDGIQDAGESGLQGATVTLVSKRPNFNPDIVTTTDANGNYLFTGLPKGSYTVKVDISTVTSGIPVGKTPSDLVQTHDWDSVGTANRSTINLNQSEINLIQDFGYIVGSASTGGGNNGGIESESLGDALTKLYVGRKKNSVPTNFVKSSKNLYNKSKMKSVQPYQGKGQSLLDMFPEELVAGNVANVTSPTDILDITIADEVLSVDFSIDGQTKGVVLGIKTTDKVYNHTKASCDRLRGAEILNVQKVKVDNYNFLMQGIKQRNGVVEYAISFAIAKNNNDNQYAIQTNWYVNNYIKYNDMYNFQVWSTKPEDTQKLVADILENLNAFIPVQQTEVQKFPETYASKIYRDKGELVVALRSTQEGNTAEVSMVELYSETANNIKFRDNALTTEIQQALRVAIADGYEYDALVKVDGEVQDAFYHADGNWGLDYDKRYTEIKNYFVWNDFDRQYQDDEYTINRNPEIKAVSEYDYLTLYKALLPGTISADYSEYKYLSFKAKGSGLMELGLIKSSIEDWKAQYKVMVDFSEEEQTYYVPFDIFSSSATQNKLTADDLTMLTFTFLPVEAQTKELDLKISDVKFTKTAVEDQIVNKIETFENEFMAYPNPSQGNINLLLFSETDTEATVTLSDVTGKVIYNQKVQLSAGKNELDFNLKVKPGIMLLKVASPETDYGTSKILFR
ncbi:SdrD B-like domain-containing protein [Polaribacter sp. M15]